ncbi:MAG: DNA topoisomerase, partial [Methanoregula sp.]
GIGDDAFRIYELVLRRFLATLAPDALWQTLKVNFDAGGEAYTTTGGHLIEPGWHEVYPFSEAKETILPAFVTGEKLPIRKVSLEEKETMPPARYTQSKLIQRMEELGLGTKSTRHEVIAKLVSRKYVEGNPLRPTLVGRVVTEALEHNADAITKPDMTQTIESHMQQIKESKRTRDDVIKESRSMLHAAFDQLEANEQVIGDDIRDRTAEELNLGRCPVCGGTLAIKHLRGSTQFIGCSRYPECTFNIGLPVTQWGWAVRTDDICEKHHLHFVRLVRKGARPWDIGCPLCHHISSNTESLTEIPTMNEALMEKARARHIYTVAEIARKEPERLAKALDLELDAAQKLKTGAEGVLEKLRRRSECRKFMRNHLIPRKGRSYSKIMAALKESGVTDLADLAKTDPAILQKAGIGETEAHDLLAEARITHNGQILKEIGIPTVSLKKYLAAGITGPDELVSTTPEHLSAMTGMSTGTVNRHVALVSGYLHQPVPVKIARARIGKGWKELLSIKGLTGTMAEKLAGAGVINGDSLLAADAGKLSGITGIDAEKIRNYQSLLRKKREDAIIRI